MRFGTMPLQDGRFMTTADARAAGVTASNPVIIAKPNSADPKRPVQYELVDQAPSKHSERWQRVVAVVCLGKKWQFSEFPYKVCSPAARVCVTSEVQVKLHWPTRMACDLLCMHAEVLDHLLLGALSLPC